jgi:hypothetical protein
VQETDKTLPVRHSQGKGDSCSPNQWRQACAANKNEDDNDLQSPKKKKKGNKKYDNRPQPEAFKPKPSKTWATHFTHKGFNDRRVGCWDGTCKMCPRGFIRGWCFKDCINAASHIGEADIPAPKIMMGCTGAQLCPAIPNTTTSINLPTTNHKHPKCQITTRAIDPISYPFDDDTSPIGEQATQHPITTPNEFPPTNTSPPPSPPPHDNPNGYPQGDANEYGA